MGDKVALDTSGGAPNRAEELAAALEVSEDPTATDDGRDQQIDEHATQVGPQRLRSLLSAFSTASWSRA